MKLRCRGLGFSRSLFLAVRARLLVLLPVLLFLPVVLAPPLNHDAAAVLAFSERWLAGEHLYSDLIDVNPPLIFVLNLAPAWLSAVTGVDAVLTLQLCVLALGAVAWRLAWLSRDRAAEGEVERAFLDVLPGLFMVLPGYDFGQREYLMMVAALPYLLGAAARTNGVRPRGRLTAAALAAIGFALKPHFLAIPVLVELAVLVLRPGSLRVRLRDSVAWLMVLIWLLYLASLPWLFPDYLGVVVPLVWELYLTPGPVSLFGVVLVPHLAVAEALLAPLLVFAARGKAPLPRILGLAALGTLGSAIVQHKGWSYHILPVALFTTSLAAVLAARWLDQAGVAREPRSGHRIGAALAGLVTLYMVSNGEAPWLQFNYPGSDSDVLTQLLQDNAEGARVLVLSPGISPIFPALNYAHARLTLRTMSMWLLEGAYLDCPLGAEVEDPGGGRHYHDPWEMDRPEFFVYRTVAEDFARNPPAAVVVDRETGIARCGGVFDFIAYFSRHPLFAEMWSHYQLQAEFGRYQMYTRKD